MPPVRYMTVYLLSLEAIQGSDQPDGDGKEADG
jgi:hypothetical protein